MPSRMPLRILCLHAPSASGLMARVRAYVILKILRIPWKKPELSLPGYLLLHSNTCRSARWGTVARLLSMCWPAMVMCQQLATHCRVIWTHLTVFDLQKKGHLAFVREQTVCTTYTEIVHTAHISHSLWARQHIILRAFVCSHLLIPGKGTSIAPI